MRAVRLHATGGPEVLRLEDAPEPEPGPDDAIVAVRAAGLNHLDLWVRQGKPAPALPHTSGSDGAGVVAALGAEAARHAAKTGGPKEGDEVVIDPSLSCGGCPACRAGEASLCEQFRVLGEGAPGTLAERVRVPWRNLHRRPARLSWPEAAAFPLTFLTAWRMLVTRARLRPGESVLVTGIGGGVSVAALAIARAAGARSVVVTSSSDAKISRAKELGASAGVNYRTTAAKDLAGALRAANGGRGFDVVVDSAGAEAWAANLRALRKGGRLVLCGATTGGAPPAELHRLFWGQIEVLGSTMGTPAEMRAVCEAVEAGLLSPVVDAVLPLERHADAFARLESGAQLGKVVVEVAP